ncbi:MAG: GntR family transcriptional regulator [Spirosomaceae bacterium]|nr:GntR family transcriptional regulator [Spirosomataceae bacterium]
MESARQYVILYNRLKAEILSSAYAIDSVLPSENELCASQNLSRSTVRQALSRLEAEGYIVKQKGKGSIVKAKRRALNLLSFQGFSATVSSDKISTLSVQVPKLTTWPKDFVFELPAIEAEASCIVFSRVRMIDDTPVMFETTYLPNLNLPRFVKNYQVQQSFFEYLATAHQVEITGMEQEIWAIQATDDIAQRLAIKPETPVLKINRKYFTNRPHLTIYSFLYYNTEKYSMGNTSKS